MRKLLSILLLALFGLPIVSPFMAMAEVAGGAERTLPACCRRAGQHRCALTAEEHAGMLPGSGSKVQASHQLCPMWPVATVWGTHGTWMPDTQIVAGAITPSVHLTGVSQTESRQRISLDRSRQERGPPAAVLF